MERFKVSGDELREFYKTETQLGRVFMDIERDLKSSNQVVCQFIVNGLELEEDDEYKFSVISLQEVVTLEYLIEESGTLLVSVIESWIDALPELIVNTEKLAQRIRGKGLKDSYKSIHDLVENCEYLVESMVSLKRMLGDRLAGFSKHWDEAEKVSHKAVKQAIDALEAKDFVQLADILEYDLNHALQAWFESLIQIGELFEVPESAAPAYAAQQARSHTSGRRRQAH